MEEELKWGMGNTVCIPTMVFTDFFLHTVRVNYKLNLNHHHEVMVKKISAN